MTVSCVLECRCNNDLVSILTDAYKLHCYKNFAYRDYILAKKFKTDQDRTSEHSYYSDLVPKTKT